MDKLWKRFFFAISGYLRCHVLYLVLAEAVLQPTNLRRAHVDRMLRIPASNGKTKERERQGRSRCELVSGYASVMRFLASAIHSIAHHFQSDSGASTKHAVREARTYCLCARVHTPYYLLVLGAKRRETSRRFLGLTV